MSILDRLKDYNFTFSNSHMKRVRDLEAKHIQMARHRMAYLNMLAKKQLFPTVEEQAMFEQGYIDCGYEYEAEILQTVFDVEELAFIEAAVSNFRKHLTANPIEDARNIQIEDKLRMLQSKLGESK